jgi:hypothetical protein
VCRVLPEIKPGHFNIVWNLSVVIEKIFGKKVKVEIVPVSPSPI